MKIERRIKRLEEQLPSNVKLWDFIVLNAGETQQEGLVRWQAENPDKPMSGKTVYFKVVVS
jgi:hypothetical protein